MLSLTYLKWHLENEALANVNDVELWIEVKLR